MNREIAHPRGAQDVDELLAHHQINAVLVAYCQGIDRKDWDLVLSCFHEDAVDDHSQFSGTAAEFIAWAKRNHEFVATSMHVLSNVSIHILEEERCFARVESYFSSHKTVTSSRNDTFFNGSGSDEVLRRTVAGRYVDIFEHREAVGWRIARRSVVLEWVRQEPNGNYMAVAEGMDRARRDETDPLYATFPSPRSLTEATLCDRTRDVGGF